MKSIVRAPMNPLRFVAIMTMVVLALMLIFTLAACSGPSTTAAPLPLAGRHSPVVATSAKPLTNARGNLVKSLNEPAWETSQDGKTTYVTFAVTGITVDPKCNESIASAAQNGHYLKADVTVTTASSAPSEALFDLLNPNDFSTVGTDGVTETDLATMNSYMCDDNTNEPHNFTAGSKYTFSIILDTRNAHGSLIYTPAQAHSGWEWPY